MSLFAKKADMPEIYKNWEESFGDTKEEITAFFETFAGKVRVCILRKNGAVAAQLCLLPVRVMGYEAEYLYAVTTNRAYRGEGLCSYLLKEVSEMLKKEGKCGVLVPADTELQGFYKKRGFQECFLPEKHVLRALTDDKEYVQGAKAKACSVQDYIAFRQQAFAGTRCVELSEDMLRYALDSYLQNGYRLAELVWQEKRYGILYREEENILIQELTASDSEEAQIAGAAFLAAIGKEEAFLQRSYLTMGIFLPKETVENGYFNLVLD